MSSDPLTQLGESTEEHDDGESEYFDLIGESTFDNFDGTIEDI